MWIVMKLQYEEINTFIADDGLSLYALPGR